MKRSNITLIGVSKGKKKKNGEKIVCKEIMNAKFPELKKTEPTNPGSTIYPRWDE